MDQYDSLSMEDMDDVLKSSLSNEKLPSAFTRDRICAIDAVFIEQNHKFSSLMLELDSGTAQSANWMFWTMCDKWRTRSDGMLKMNCMPSSGMSSV
jgi:hypothetical protein